MNTQNNYIKNRDTYFKAVLKNMKLKEDIKQSEIEDNEVYVEDPSICSDLLADFDLEKELTDLNLVAWIDMIEDQKLHAAVKSLPIEEQTLLSYIFEKEKTQRELEEIYNLDQSVIRRRYNKIIKSIKEFVQTNDF